MHPFTDYITFSLCISSYLNNNSNLPFSCFISRPIDFHLDHSERILQVALNSDSEYEGD